VPSTGAAVVSAAVIVDRVSFAFDDQMVLHDARICARRPSRSRSMPRWRTAVWELARAR
jgi:hypothetical protein